MQFSETAAAGGGNTRLQAWRFRQQLKETSDALNAEEFLQRRQKERVAAAYSLAPSELPSRVPSFTAPEASAPVSRSVSVVEDGGAGQGSSTGHARSDSWKSVRSAMSKIALLAPGSHARKMAIKAQGISRLKTSTRRWLHIDRYGDALPDDSEENDVITPESASPLQFRIIQVYNLFAEPSTSKAASIISISLFFVILISTLSFILDTVPLFEESDAAQTTFDTVELVTVQIFAFDYAVRLITCPFSRLKFVMQPLNIIDLISIVPWYIGAAVSNKSINATSVFRVLRLLRVFRVFKLGGRYGKMGLVVSTLSNSGDVLFLILFFIGMLLIMMSTLIFFVERGDYDDELGYYVRADEPHLIEGDDGSVVPAPSPFSSIPLCFWWTMVTLMTVGYGDAYPLTAGGKAIACLTMITGILSLALPISVLGTNFTNAWLDHREAQKRRMGRASPKLQEVEEQLMTHCTNTEDLVRLFAKVEQQIDELRSQLQDKLKARKRELNHGLKSALTLERVVGSAQQAASLDGTVHGETNALNPRSGGLGALLHRLASDRHGARSAAPVDSNSNHGGDDDEEEDHVAVDESSDDDSPQITDIQRQASYMVFANVAQRVKSASLTATQEGRMMRLPPLPGAEGSVTAASRGAGSFVNWGESMTLGKSRAVAEGTEGVAMAAGAADQPPAAATPAPSSNRLKALFNRFSNSRNGRMVPSLPPGSPQDVSGTMSPPQGMSRLGSGPELSGVSGATAGGFFCAVPENMPSPSVMSNPAASGASGGDSGGAGGADGGGGGGSSGQGGDPESALKSKITQLLGTQMVSRYYRELQEMAASEKQMSQRSSYLQDLLTITGLVRSNRFPERVKEMRFKYRQFEFMHQESADIKAVISQVSNEVDEVELAMQDLEWRFQYRVADEDAQAFLRGEVPPSLANRAPEDAGAAGSAAGGGAGACGSQRGEQAAGADGGKGAGSAHGNSSGKGFFLSSALASIRAAGEQRRKSHPGGGSEPEDGGSGRRASSSSAAAEELAGGGGSGKGAPRGPRVSSDRGRASSDGAGSEGVSAGGATKFMQAIFKWRAAQGGGGKIHPAGPDRPPPLPPPRKRADNIPSSSGLLDLAEALSAPPTQDRELHQHGGQQPPVRSVTPSSPGTSMYGGGWAMARARGATGLVAAAAAAAAPPGSARGAAPALGKVSGSSDQQPQGQAQADPAAAAVAPVAAGSAAAASAAAAAASVVNIAGGAAAQQQRPPPQGQEQAGGGQQQQGQAASTEAQQQQQQQQPLSDQPQGTPRGPPPPPPPQQQQPSEVTPFEEPGAQPDITTQLPGQPAD